MNRHQRKAHSAEMSDMTRRKAAGGLVRHPRPQRLLIGVAAAALAAAVLVPSGSAASRPSLARPSGLHSFIKRLDEPRRLAAPDVPEYSRTPSFAWAPVRGATRYEFQLSTSDRFRADNGLVWSSKTLLTPATTIPLSLPWITGDPASLYWRVRAVSGGSRLGLECRSAVQHALVERAERMAARQRVARRQAGLRPLAPRRRGHQLPGVVRESRRQGHLDDHERGRRARVLHVQQGLDR